MVFFLLSRVHDLFFVDDFFFFFTISCARHFSYVVFFFPILLSRTHHFCIFLGRVFLSTISCALFFIFVGRFFFLFCCLVPLFFLFDCLEPRIYSCSGVRRAFGDSRQEKRHTKFKKLYFKLPKDDKFTLLSCLLFLGF